MIVTMGQHSIETITVIALLLCTDKRNDEEGG